MAKLKHERRSGVTDPAQFISKVVLDAEGDRPVRIVTISQQRLFNASSRAFQDVDTSYQRMELQCAPFRDAAHLLGSATLCLIQLTPPWRVRSLIKLYRIRADTSRRQLARRSPLLADLWHVSMVLSPMSFRSR